MKLPKGRGETRISIQVNKWIQHEYKIDDYGFYYKHCVIINCFCSKVVAKSWHKHTELEEIGFKNSKFDLQFICLWEELVSFWTGKLHLDWNIRIYMRGYRCFGPLLWFYFYHSKCQKKTVIFVLQYCHLKTLYYLSMTYVHYLTHRFIQRSAPDYFMVGWEI